MALRLGVAPEEMADVLDRIEETGLVDRSTTPWHPKRLAVGGCAGWRCSARKTGYRQYLELATAFLTTSEGREQSDEAAASNENEAAFSGATFSVNKERLPTAIRMIRHFRRSLAAFLSGKPEEAQNDEVYRLNIQLFPLTKPTRNG
jgi:uncharacterized protein (TIGR02147 family)